MVIIIGEKAVILSQCIHIDTYLVNNRDHPCVILLTTFIYQRFL